MAYYSSVMMAVKIREWYPDHNIIYAMANTSKERPESHKKRPQKKFKTITIHKYY